MNKKIKNATPHTNFGINFKSKTEERYYSILVKAGFDPKYEDCTYTLWEGLKVTTPYYTRGGKSSQKDLILKSQEKLRPITYTPDFTFTVGNTIIFMEVKGYMNDVYPIKRKLFRAYLEKVKNSGQRVAFFEIFSVRHLMQAINIIKTQYASKNKGHV